MSNFISIYSMPFISDLLTRHEADLKSAINNLTYLEIKEEGKIEQIKSSLKRIHLLEPVQFGEIKLKTHQYEQRPYNMARQIAGLATNVYILVFSVPYTGNSELFHFHPMNGMTFSSSDRGVLLPDYDDELTVEVEVDSLDKVDSGKKNAEGLLAMTKRLIALNNNEINAWNARQNAFIDAELPAKRVQLAKIYGNP